MELIGCLSIIEAEQISLPAGAIAPKNSFSFLAHGSFSTQWALQWLGSEKHRVFRGLDIGGFRSFAASKDAATAAGLVGHHGICPNLKMVCAPRGASIASHRSLRGSSSTFSYAALVSPGRSSGSLFNAGSVRVYIG